MLEKEKKNSYYVSPYFLMRHELFFTILLMNGVTLRNIKLIVNDALVKKREQMMQLLIINKFGSVLQKLNKNELLINYKNNLIF